MRRPEAHQLVLIPILLLFACSPPPSQEEGSSPSDGFPTLSGPYLGQAPALAEPAVFAPGIVSTGFAERDVAMIPTDRRSTGRSLEASTSGPRFSSRDW